MIIVEDLAIALVNCKFCGRMITISQFLDDPRKALKENCHIYGQVESENFFRATHVEARSFSRV